MTTATAQRRYVVRVALDDGQSDAILGTVDFMKVAGYAVVHEEADAPLLFDLCPPADVADEDTRSWADQLAAKMEEQGYNAVTAPPWPEHGDDEDRPEPES